MLRQPYDTPILKTKSLCLVTNGGRFFAAIQTAHKALPLAVTGDAFCHLPPARHTLKLKALRIVSNEGWAKCLLLLHKWLIQPYSVP